MCYYLLQEVVKFLKIFSVKLCCSYFYAMIKKDLRLQTGFYSITMSKLAEDENVSMDVIEKICMILNCDVGDIMEFVSDKKEAKQL